MTNLPLRNLFSCIATLTLVASQASPSEPVFVVGHWTFDEGVAGESAVFNRIPDLSGLEHDGLPVNAPVYTESPRTLALNLNGQNQFVFVQDSRNFQLSSFTLEAWIYPRSSHREQLIFFRGDQRDGRDPYYLGLNDRLLNFAVADRQFGGSSLTYELPSLDDWYHVACTFSADDDAMALYIDGRPVRVSETAIDPILELDHSAFPGIGIANAQDPGYSRFFHGMIDEVRISNRALLPMPGGFSIDGDVDADGVVGLSDLNAVRDNFGASSRGDVNGDGLTDLVDLNTVRNHFGEGEVRSVPEPSGVAIMFTLTLTVAFSSARRRATCPR